MLFKKKIYDLCLFEWFLSCFLLLQNIIGVCVSTSFNYRIMYNTFKGFSSTTKLRVVFDGQTFLNDTFHFDNTSFKVHLYRFNLRRCPKQIAFLIHLNYLVSSICVQNTLCSVLWNCDDGIATSVVNRWRNSKNSMSKTLKTNKHIFDMHATVSYIDFVTVCLYSCNDQCDS